MEGEISALEQKLDHLLALCRELRAENQDLRARLTGLESDKRKLAERMDSARVRLESLMERLPGI